MRSSQLFGQTIRQAPKEAQVTSHQLLLRAGFIKESSAGRYYFLPLGWRVHEKIRSVIKEEMDQVGGQEMLSPVLHPLALWEETNRTKTTAFELMKVKDRNGAEFALGGTAEEMFVDLIRKYRLSYKDLPLNLYQFSTKFRDELRPRGGLLRVREFVMKDAYSFDHGEKEFKKTYALMRQTYQRIFNRLGLETLVIESDNGYIGGEYCHEFVVPSEIGESKYLFSEDGQYAAHEDVAKFKRQKINLDEKEKPFQIIAQPQWVQTMEDNVKHYQLPKARFLKNVVYKNRTNGEVIIAIIRGDLEVNQLKLEHVLDAVGQLEPASQEDLQKIGTKPGYVHCWGHRPARYIGDTSLTTVRNFIGGQKEDETDSLNVNYGRDFTCEKLADIALAKEGDLTEDGRQKLKAGRGVEVGNIFQLGYHYTKLMQGANFIDQDGQEKPYYMGCYGIGLGRTIAAVVEKHRDEKGIVWPEIVSPFTVHLIPVENTPAVAKAAEKVYADLEKEGIDALFDDRAEKSAGEKFMDADLLGITWRLVVSQKTLEQEKVEMKKRSENLARLVTFHDAQKILRKNST